MYKYMFNNGVKYPNLRPRRLRQAAWIRDLVQENKLTVNDLIYPIFVQEGSKSRSPIKTLPDISRLSVDLVVEEAKKSWDLGIKAIALFPATPADKKNSKASEAYNSKNLICKTVKAIKKSVPDIGVICDVALDPYTDHGHDGIMINNKIANDETISVLIKQALILADAGCDVVAPSDMMDGRIGRIRLALEEKKYTDVIILSYAAKYASKFYGPFRDAVGSSSSLGSADKKTYQMNYANKKEAITEAMLDVSEGADIIMVKPAMPYLDIISKLSENISIPVFAYQVSGEYAMIKNAITAKIIDKEAMIESLISIKRAGAMAILSYDSINLAKIL